ncbi:hypothetical protein CTI12_AA628530 [Artemisia annua]|uniref:Uncharacterized protein n=1 Tax=Artemisia annua TaxID=35608 RepID=A0A2U1K9L3_ARTAN|nr:hypothetical protein CTI12_AA628530 [Artemisia annua]
MEGKQAERPNITLQQPNTLKMEETKKHQIATSRFYAEIAHIATPRGPSDTKPNCLCSPTTHAGSFRCRYHRSSSLGNHGSSFNHLSNLDDQNQTAQ